MYTGYFWLLRFKIILGHSVHFRLMSFDNCVSQKQLDTERNGPKIWTSGVSKLVYTGYFRPLSVPGHSEVIRCISDFRPCISKKTGRRMKLTKLWVWGGGGGKFLVNTGYLWFKSSRSVWGDSVHYQFFRQHLCVSKTADCSAKRTKIWASGEVLSVCRVLTTFKCLRSLWGHSDAFQFSTTLYLENG